MDGEGEKLHNAKILLETLSIYGNYLYFIPLEGRSYLQSYTEELSLSFKKIIKTKIRKLEVVAT